MTLAPNRIDITLSGAFMDPLEIHFIPTEKICIC
jgi:hypothetical protein